MIKRILSLLLCVVLVLSLIGCGQNAAPAEDSTADTVPATTAAPETTEPPATEAAPEAPTEASPDTVEVDKGLLTVELTIPASYFGDMDMSTFDTDAYVAENGFLSADLDENGSLVVVMTKAKQSEILDDMTDSIDDMIAGYTTAEDTAYIKEITYGKDFTSFTMSVDREAYENTFDATAISLVISAGFYQMFAGVEAHVDFIVLDAATGETISSTTY